MLQFLPFTDKKKNNKKKKEWLSGEGKFFFFEKEKPKHFYNCMVMSKAGRSTIQMFDASKKNYV